MSIELKPCPFCGGKARLCISEYIPPWIECDCGVFTEGQNTAEEAAEMWNRRATDDH